jgi:N-acyl-D-aspartate/D-glutamate deacylase
MDYRFLIQGGRVVDGTGAASYDADVRVAGGRIVEVGQALPPHDDERIIDAAGCLVTPGFIETHNHWDGSVWWSPVMDPLSANGVTTSINGNCGFSMAPSPADPADRETIIEIFNFFEDIPEPPMKSQVPWNWRFWSEYKASMQRRVKLPVNYAAFCGHIPIRLCVMGQDAWTRIATPDEIEQMVMLLEDALQAGAMGLSSNLLDYDKWERPLPSQVADDAEFAALLDVISRHEGATFQVIVDHFMRMTGPDSVERMARLAKAQGVRMQWVGAPILKYQRDSGRRSDVMHEQFKTEGLPFYTGFHHVSPTSVINFGRSLVFAQNGNPVWQEVVNAEGWPAKAALLSDPVWRDRARDSWDNQFAHSYLHQPEALFLRESESGQGPIGITLGQYIAQSGINHPSDALAQWVLRNGAESVIFKTSWELDEARVIELLRDPNAIGNISDAGAHGKLFCGAGDNILLLTSFVRDRPILTIEEAVHNLTGKLADFFGLSDRGAIREGLTADIAVFNLAEVERRPEEKVWDVPDGEGGRTYRYTRAAAPMRLTLCNGIPTFDHAAFTGRFPGRFLGPELPQALAAE